MQVACFPRMMAMHQLSYSRSKDWDMAGNNYTGAILNMVVQIFARSLFSAFLVSKSSVAVLYSNRLLFLDWASCGPGFPQLYCVAS